MVWFNHLFFLRIKDIIYLSSSLHAFWSLYSSIVNNSLITFCSYKVNKLGYITAHFTPNTLMFLNLGFSLTIYTPPIVV
jgi:hypothetical protein